MIKEREKNISLNLNKIGLILFVIVALAVFAFTSASLLTQTYTSTGNLTGGFFNNTVANSSGILLSGTNLSGDYQSFIFYNASAMNWIVTLGLANNISVNQNATLQFRTASAYNTTDPSLVAFWSFNHDNSSTVFDELGKNNGTRVGGIADAAESNGVVGKGYAFNPTVGKDLSIPFSQILNFSNKSISISYWVKPGDTNDKDIFNQPAGGYRQFAIAGSGTTPKTNLLANETSNGLANYCSVTATGSVIINSWAHYVFVLNQINTSYGNWSIYKNGVLSASAICPGYLLLNGNAFGIGVWTAAGWVYNGSIDEIRLYNRTLAPSEVLDLYNMGATQFNDWSGYDSEQTCYDNETEILTREEVDCDSLIPAPSNLNQATDTASHQTLTSNQDNIGINNNNIKLALETGSYYFDKNGDLIITLAGNDVKTSIQNNIEINKNIGNNNSINNLGNGASIDSGGLSENLGVGLSNNARCYIESWKYFKDLTGNDTVTTLNPITGEREFNLPSAYQTYEHNGDMYRVKTSKGDLVISPEHKIYVKIDYSNNYSKNQGIYWQIAGVLLILLGLVGFFKFGLWKFGGKKR